MSDGANACTRCGGTFPFEAWADPELSPDVGDTVPIGPLIDGRYRLEEFIARGGMGEVFRGVDVGLDRNVALKFLARRYCANDELVARFLKEARAAASLDHPNVIPIYATGEHERRPFIAMKYVVGQTVHQHVRANGPMSVAQASAVVNQVCKGLEKIHEAGYVHRDIKPQNLMLDGSGHCYILDFGILKIVHGAKTTTGLVLGTPAYMAPEQAIDAKSADARSDLYGLAVALYEMVTGQLPFRGRTAFELMRQHISDPPPLPTSVVPTLPHAFDLFMAKALAKPPAQRFQNALEFRRMLRFVGVGGTPS